MNSRVRTRSVPPALTTCEWLLGLRVVLGNALMQVQSIQLNANDVEQLDIAMKAMALTKDAIETALPLLRVERRRMLRNVADTPKT